MTLSAEQKMMVQLSFGQIAISQEAVAETFYTRLFEVAPAVRLLFKGDINEQGIKLMQMVATAVASLDRLDEVVPAIHDLGRRHAAYGVQPEQYDTVGEVLLWTLESVLQDDFTPDVKAAWTEVYTVLASTAIAGAAN